MAPTHLSAPVDVNHCSDRIALLKVVNLCFDYPQRKVFTNFSATVSAGVSLVQGGDGAGKSTLLRLLAGNLQAHSGSLQVCSENATANANAKAQQSQIFWIDPRCIEFDAISPRTFFDMQQGLWPDFDDSSMPALIEGLSLTEFIDKPLYMLSTGSKRKVWLAAAFSSNAILALLDDPFAALDKPSIRFVTEVLNSFNAQSKRAVVITGYGPPEGLRLAEVIDLGG